MRGDLPVTIPRDAAREAAERELSKPIYHENDPNLLQRALNWLWDKIDTVLSTASNTTPGGWFGLVALVVVIVLLIVALRLRLGRIRQATAHDAALFDHAPHTAAQHRAAAEQHAAQRRWAEAVQERMRALVRALEERAVLDIRPGRTADEAAAEAGRFLPDHSSRLRNAARAFDDITYGGHTATEQTYAALLNLDIDLQHSRPRFTETPAAANRGAPA